LFPVVETYPTLREPLRGTGTPRLTPSLLADAAPAIANANAEPPELSGWWGKKTKHSCRVAIADKPLDTRVIPLQLAMHTLSLSMSIYLAFESSYYVPV